VAEYDPRHTKARYKTQFGGTVAALFSTIWGYYSHLCHTFIGASSSATGSLHALPYQKPLQNLILELPIPSLTYDRDANIQNTKLDNLEYFSLLQNHIGFDEQFS
jgi:hypothetical protein